MAGRPPWLFDREREWTSLSDFAAAERPGSSLAIVYGRRRQGKTTLLEAVAEATGGYYWQAGQQSSRQNLMSFSAAFAAWSSSPGEMRFANWEDAFAAIFGLRREDEAVAVMIDEFGYLLEGAPEVASIIQARLTPSEMRTGRTRLVLCGSAYAQMRALTGPDAPLRGRASLELVVGPFDYRAAAAFWGLAENPDAAFRLHALVGGTPGYLQLAGSRPVRGNVDRWATEHLLQPSSPLHREGRVLVAEDARLNDRALYWGVLAAIADGHTRRSELAAATGRPDSALTFPLRVLAESGWIEQRTDPLHARRTSMSLTEPIVRAHRVLIEPEELRLNRGQASAVWEDGKARLVSRVYGPHLEWLAMEWLLTHAAPATVGGSPRLVGPAVLQGAGRRSQLDIVAVQPTRHGRDEVILVGETKAERAAMGLSELHRLDEVVDRLGQRAAPEVRRLLVARAGFTAELRRAARRRADVELADLSRLYDGS